MRLLLLLILFQESIGLKTVTTSYGKVRGITDYSILGNDKFIFKGIPFVKPPLGDLRFSMPQKPDKWEGVLDASTYKAACPSNSSLSEHAQNFISEDCLYINIFTSQYCLKNKCPVIVYYHGGSYNLDSATMFPDKFILERYVDKGTVFVIPAYRLGVLGQFWLGDKELVPANLLVYDAIEALYYVQDEISNFGGNPNDVTIMGHSSGGQLVNALGVSSYVDPEQELFQKFIVLSSYETFELEHFKINNSLNVAKRVNCFSKNHQEILKCMRNTDVMQILQAQRTMEDEDTAFFKSLIQAPPLMDYGEKLAEIKKRVPPRKLLCGVTEHEFEKYPYREGFRVEGVFLDFENPVETVTYYHDNFFNKTRNMFNTDSSAVFVSTATYTEAIVNAGGEVYLFETRQKPYSMHVSDMQYFIGIHRELHHTSDMDILDSFYSQMLVNFTKFGEPSPYWNKLDAKEMKFLALEIDTEKGIGPKMENGFHKELVDFWLVDMMELDKNITEQKQTKGSANGEANGEVNPTPMQINLTTLGSPNSTEVILESTIFITYVSPIPPRQTTYDPKIDEDQPVEGESAPIYNQWWFYVIIILIVIIAAVLILLALNKNNDPESLPLLA
ncbi:hypothetical protein L3Y34_010424 [Caenorhabditis briggsae]|uniref:Carboxylic ester hydrolase n=1 Tax=Caenorhabditis briggsae TaxID=6238 RepID=A0AAE8ZLI5_CAEBR|nr:hypothetical protein L3Y34_010424 [Caenorhabditis briggsae]